MDGVVVGTSELLTAKPAWFRLSRVVALTDQERERQRREAEKEKKIFEEQRQQRASEDEARRIQNDPLYVAQRFREMEAEIARLKGAQPASG